MTNNDPFDLLNHITVDDAAEQFLLACRASGLRERTVILYIERLRRFRAMFSSREIQSITINDLRQYFTRLRDITVKWQNHPFIPPQKSHLSEETIHGYYRGLRRFFNWCIEEQIIETSPVAALRMQRPHKRIPKGISVDAFKVILSMTEGDNVWKKRDRAIILFLGDTGCRASGLVNLNVGDINLKDQFALLREKGGKERFAPFSEVTRDALAEYIELRPRITVEEENALFISQRTRRRFSPWGIHQMVDRLAKRAGLTENMSLHRWRHAFARWYLLNGGDLATLSDLLGHSDVEVTRDYYAIFNRAELKQKHNAHSMIARLFDGDSEKE